MTARGLFALVRDLRAAGIPYETEDGSEHPLPMPVRHQAALYVAIGGLCRRIDEALDYEGFAAACELRKRCHMSLRWIEAIGKRSRWAGRFR